MATAVPADVYRDRAWAWIQASDPVVLRNLWFLLFSGAQIHPHHTSDVYLRRLRSALFPGPCPCRFFSMQQQQEVLVIQMDAARVKCARGLSSELCRATFSAFSSACVGDWDRRRSGCPPHVQERLALVPHHVRQLDLRLAWGASQCSCYHPRMNRVNQLNRYFPHRCLGDHTV